MGQGDIFYFFCLAVDSLKMSLLWNCDYCFKYALLSSVPSFLIDVTFNVKSKCLSSFLFLLFFFLFIFLFALIRQSLLS